MFLIIASFHKKYKKLFAKTEAGRTSQTASLLFLIWLSGFNKNGHIIKHFV